MNQIYKEYKLIILIQSDSYLNNILMITTGILALDITMMRRL